jgi:hypothetical protein
MVLFGVSKDFWGGTFVHLTPSYLPHFKVQKWGRSKISSPVNSNFLMRTSHSHFSSPIRVIRKGEAGRGSGPSFPIFPNPSYAAYLYESESVG